MNVLIAGMQRSASTFTFNVARLLLEKSGWVVAGNGPDLGEPPPSEGRHFLYKTHHLEPDALSGVLADDFRIIVSHRDPREAIASWIRTFDFTLETAIDQYRMWFELFEAIRHDALCVPFEQIERRPGKAVKAIARHLGIHAGPIERWSIARTLRKEQVFAQSRRLEKNADSLIDVEFSKYDPRTFFHVQHIKSLERPRVDDVLSRKDIATIESALGHFMEKLPTGVEKG